MLHNIHLQFTVGINDFNVQLGGRGEQIVEWVAILPPDGRSKSANVKNLQRLNRARLQPA